MPFRITGISKVDVQGALTDQGYTAARAPKLDQLDAAISSRAAPGAAMDINASAETKVKSQAQSALTDQGYTTTRAGYLDAAITSRAAPGAAMALASPYDARLDVAVSSRASATDYTSARAGKLDNLDALISSRAAAGAAMDLVAGAKTAIWNEAIPGVPTGGSYGERIKNNLDAAITSRAAPGAAMALASPFDARLDVAVSTRASPTDVDTKLGDRGITTARMAKMDLVAVQATAEDSVTAPGNTTGLTVSLDTSGAAGQARAVIEVRYTCGAAAELYAEGSDDGTTWYEGDHISEGAAATNKLVGYLNAHRHFRFRSPTTGIALSFYIKALL